MALYDVYLAPFKFEDTNQTKIRPVVEVDNDKYCILCVKITSQNKSYYTTQDYALKDWQQAGLQKPSVVRTAKVDVIDKPNLIKYIGHLSEQDIQGLRSFVEGFPLSGNTGIGLFEALAQLDEGMDYNMVSLKSDKKAPEIKKDKDGNIISINGKIVLRYDKNVGAVVIPKEMKDFWDEL